MPELSYREQLDAVLEQKDLSTSSTKAIGGLLFLNPKCMEGEDGNNFALTERVVFVLRHMFDVLGHKVSVFVTYANPTKVLSRKRSVEDVQEIKHLTNIAFAAFFAEKHHVDRTITLLENTGVIPCLTSN